MTAKSMQRVRLRAQQTLFYNERLYVEGEVYDYVGAELPGPEIAQRVPNDEPLGLMPVAPSRPPGQAPEWTTRGYVDDHNRKAHKADDLFD